MGMKESINAPVGGWERERGEDEMVKKGQQGNGGADLKRRKKGDNAGKAMLEKEYARASSLVCSEQPKQEGYL